ncbi:hypothetical protein HF313_18435 [Massilia atriviolacea]|uniref:Uncharacterized protein n=1 Tax=Massilia atriviolacea TaxID=2495579 RepID=A0A430HT66_9BURK|nr:hypothetical protein [Massilia atriviolacea]RSZ60738.1 hypothetical protein EJB06_00950 [Massilia atriviolacea]
MTANTRGDGPQRGDPPTEIADIAQLQEQIMALLERINSDRRLALAAAVNPLLALEELGYRLAPPVRREIERRSRYTKRQLVRLDALRADFARLVPDFAIEDADLLSSAQVRRLLRETLDIADARIPCDLDLPRGAGPDPLEALADAHPALPALLGLRDIERHALRFATHDQYRDVRSGKLSLPIEAISGKPAQRARSGGENDHG